MPRLVPWLLALVLVAQACVYAQIAAPGNEINTSGVSQGYGGGSTSVNNQTAAPSDETTATNAPGTLYSDSQTSPDNNYQSDSGAAAAPSPPPAAGDAAASPPPQQASPPPPQEQQQQSSSSSSNNNNSNTGGSCIDDPSSPSCKDYKYSDDSAVSDLKALCKSKPYLSACSLFRLCNQGVDPTSIGRTPTTCNKFQLLATACSLDSIAAEEQECRNYKSLCLTDKTTVQQCNSTSGLQHVIPTAAARQLSRMMCEGTEGGPCKRCDWSQDTPACDMFSVYGALCSRNPEMNECSPWLKMCHTDGSLYVCREQLPGGRPGPAGPPHLSSSGGGMGAAAGAPAPPPQWAPSAAGSMRLDALAALAGVLLAVAAVL